MARIELNEISHSYRRKPKSDADFAIKRIHHIWESGGAYALLGPSGCGKTTLAKLMAAKAGKFGLLQQDALSYAYHLDATRYAGYLRQLAEQDGDRVEPPVGHDQILSAVRVEIAGVDLLVVQSETAGGADVGDEVDRLLCLEPVEAADHLPVERPAPRIVDRDLVVADVALEADDDADELVREGVAVEADVDLAAAAGDDEVVLGEAVDGMGVEFQVHLVPGDGDVGVVALLLGHVGHFAGDLGRDGSHAVGVGPFLEGDRQRFKPKLVRFQVVGCAGYGLRDLWQRRDWLRFRVGERVEQRFRAVGRNHDDFQQPRFREDQGAGTDRRND